MPWLKIDDGFCEHPKIDGLSDGAFRLHVSGMNYAARHLTDGVIPVGRIPRLVPNYSPLHLDELVAGVPGEGPVWHGPDHGCDQCPEVAEGTYLVHDYHQCNPTAAKVLADREEARQRAKKNRRSTKRSDQRGTDRPSEGSGQRNTERSGEHPVHAPPNGSRDARRTNDARSPAPVPYPVPGPVVGEPLSSSPLRDGGFDDDDTVIISPTLDAACSIVANERLRRRLIADKAPEVGDPDAWAAEAARRAFPEVLDATEKLAQDATADDLASWVLQRERVRHLQAVRSS